jgi:DNA-directed RNA polymerase specialized sigma subunit
MPKYYNLTQIEIDDIKAKANFTEEENQYFDLKRKDKTNTEIAAAMNISESKVSRLARKVRDKYIKVTMK